jgi:hypothetical protein
MSTVKFLGLSCLVFVVIGSLIPIPTIAVSAAISTGDIGKLNGMFLLSGMSYLFGGLVALEVGAVFAVCTWLLARFVPRIVPSERAYLRAPFGAALGAAIGCSFVAPAFSSRLSGMRMNPPFKDDLALALLVWWRSDAPSSLTFFVLPSLLCGAIAAAWLLPRLLANPSFHRTGSLHRFD